MYRTISCISVFYQAITTDIVEPIYEMFKINWMQSTKNRNPSLFTLWFNKLSFDELACNIQKCIVWTLWFNKLPFDKNLLVIYKNVLSCSSINTLHVSKYERHHLKQADFLFKLLCLDRGLPSLSFWSEVDLLSKSSKTDL